MVTYLPRDKGGPGREWLLRMADIEDLTKCVAAGGMAADFGMVAHREYYATVREGNTMSEVTVRCPKCGYKWIVITELLNADLRLIADSQAAEIGRLRDLIPDPRELSGWDDDGCPPDVAVGLIKLAEAKGIEVPKHLQVMRMTGGE